MTTSNPVALEELMALPIDKRIEAIDQDLSLFEKRFERIDSFDLAAALEVPEFQKPGNEWSFVRYAEIISVEEYARFCSPASEIVYLIQNDVSETRFQRLIALSEPLDTIDEPNFEFLTAIERSDLERAIAEKQLEANSSNAMNCLAHYSVVTETGNELRFEAVVEDDGSCLGLLTPYDFKMGKFVDLTKCVTDTW